MKQLIFQTFIIVYLLALCSCSATKRNNSSDTPTAIAYGGKEYVDAFVSQVKPRWYDTVPRFRLENAKKELVPHRFFDVAPMINTKKKTANIIITTPAESLYGNDLDLLSGQFYVNRKFCSQNDQWGRMDGSITTPSFSIGVMPRVLDQLNLPQKVIVFGGKEYFRKYYKTHYFDVRIVGAYIEQICPYGACVDNKQWNSRLVLVAVQNGHNEFEDIAGLSELKKKVDWNYVRAFVENGMGKNKISKKYYPGYRMGAEVTAGQALAFMERNSTIFTIPRLKKMRMSCYKLYDYLWKDLSYISADEIVAKNKREIREKAIKLSSSLGRGKKRTKPFYKRFAKNFKKYHEQYKTCTQYIYPSNINYSSERHWFFAHYTAFHRLHGLGYHFDCNGNKWKVNPYIASGRRAIPMENQLINCSARDIDIAMEFSIKTLENIRQRHHRSYRYIDYDRGVTGTHNKLYSWVPSSEKLYSCSTEDDQNFIINKASFPSDIRWRTRGKEGKTKTSFGEIIY